MFQMELNGVGYFRQIAPSIISNNNECNINTYLKKGEINSSSSKLLRITIFY